MNSKSLFYAGGMTLLVLFSGFAFVQFNDALTPYVSYEQAIASPRTVQVAGGLQKGSSAYDESSGLLHFTLVDQENVGKTLPVRYEGVKPANFEEAISIVAIGSWDEGTEEFAAHNLLVKCPSKYQGVEGYEAKSYEAGEQGYGEQGYGAGEQGYGAGEQGYGTEGVYGAAPRTEGYAATPAVTGDEG